MDRLDRMRIFTRVAEMASFTRAAESLGLPKASISSAIQQLEAHLKTRLFHRTTRKVQLTQDGTSFYERCRDLLSEVEDIESMFERGPANVSGRIRFDMPNAIAKRLVVPRLHEFMDQYPGVALEISATDRRVDLIREGFDCVVRVGQLTESGLVARRIGQLTLINCVSPQYVKKFGKPKTIEDLAKHHLIHYSGVLGAPSDGFEYFDGESYVTVPVGGRIAVNNTDAYLSTCLAGFGIVQIPEVGVRAHLEAGELTEILPKLRAEPMPVSLVYPHRRNLSRRVKLFMDWLEGVIEEYCS